MLFGGALRAEIPARFVDVRCVSSAWLHPCHRLVYVGRVVLWWGITVGMLFLGYVFLELLWGGKRKRWCCCRTREQCQLAERSRLSALPLLWCSSWWNLHPPHLHCECFVDVCYT